MFITRHSHSCPQLSSRHTPFLDANCAPSASIILCSLPCWSLICSAPRSLVAHAAFCTVLFLPAAAFYSLLPVLQHSPGCTFSVLSDGNGSWRCSISGRVCLLPEYLQAPRPCLPVCVAAGLFPQPGDDLLPPLQDISMLCPKLRQKKTNTEAVLFATGTFNP